MVIGLASGGETSDDLMFFLDEFLIDFPVVMDAGATYLYYLQDGAVSPYPLDYIIDQEGRVAYFDSEYDPDRMITVIDELLGKTPEIRVEPTEVDLGPVVFGESAWALLSVLNEGAGDLHVSGIESSDPEFTVNLESLIIGPGSSQALIVEFTPSELGPQSGELTIISDDVDEAVLLVDLYGEGVTAVSVDFPTRGFHLAQNKPNPFLAETSIRFSLLENGYADITVYDLRGRLVRRLGDSGPRTEGDHIEIWDGRDDRGRELPSGVYFYKLRAGGKERTRKAILLR